MGGCCSENGAEAKKKFRFVGALCVLILLVGLIVTWFAASDAQEKQAARKERLNATEHENRPVSRGDLDRG
jgi:hypothetical protein